MELVMFVKRGGMVQSAKRAAQLIAITVCAKEETETVFRVRKIGMEVTVLVVVIARKRNVVSMVCARSVKMTGMATNV